MNTTSKPYEVDNSHNRKYYRLLLKTHCILFWIRPTEEMSKISR